MTQRRVQKMTLTAVFAALLCICSQIVIPLGAVPITLQTAAVYIAALALGPANGTVAIALYLLLGAVGLPVYAGGTGGFGVLIGPLGGFLWGFLLVPVISGTLIRKLNQKKWISYVIALIPGFFVVFGLGVIWLKYALSLTWGAAMMAGVIPYLPGDFAKIAFAALICQRLYRAGFGYGAQ
jgi:biotin transport system substrate-specific component